MLANDILGTSWVTESRLRLTPIIFMTIQVHLYHLGSAVGGEKHDGSGGGMSQIGDELRRK